MEERGAEAGVEGGGGFLHTAAQLYAAAKPLLAVKAYERALSEEDAASLADTQSLEAVELARGHALFKDFVLHCNALSIKSVGTNIKVARDILRVGLEELQRRGYVRVDLETDGVGEGSTTEQSDEGVAFLVSVTLNNWACLLMRSRQFERAGVFFQAALSASVTQEVTYIVILNICALYIHNGSFSETRAAAMEVFAGQESTEPDAQEKVSEDDVNGDLNELFFAFAHHNVAIAEECLEPHEAESYYAKAKELMVGSPYQQWSTVIEYARRRFQNIVQRRREEAVQRRELAESEMEAARQVEATLRRRGKSARNGAGMASSFRSVSRGKRPKKGALGASVDVREEPIEFPPIDKPVLQRIREKGLACVVVPLLRIAEVKDTVFGKNRPFEGSPFFSLLDPTPNNIAMVLLCEETPLQVADEAELEGSAPVKRSIWSFVASRHDNVELSPSSPLKRIPADIVPTEATHIAKLFVPAPLSEKVINNAQRDVAGVKKLLTHRLTVLLRAENAFEEKWKATMMVRNALAAFNVAQDIVKLKAVIKEKRERRAILEDASARRIVRFFRMVVGIKLSKEVPMPKEVRAKYYEIKAAITLQKFARRWLATKELRALQSKHQAEILSVLKIQSIYHRRAAHRHYLDLKEQRENEVKAWKEEEARELAAIQIQRAYRRHAYRLAKWRQEGQMRQFILHHYRCSRDYYATLIQRTFRGFLARRVYGREVYARRCYGRNRYRAEVLNRCAAIIQSVFRGHRVRRTKRILLQQHVLRRLNERGEEQRRRRDEAARVIQCAYRSYVARRTASQLRVLRERERLLRRRFRYPSFRLEEQVY